MVTRRMGRPSTGWTSARSGWNGSTGEAPGITSIEPGLWVSEIPSGADREAGRRDEITTTPTFVPHRSHKGEELEAEATSISPIAALRCE